MSEQAKWKALEDEIRQRRGDGAEAHGRGVSDAASHRRGAL